MSHVRRLSAALGTFAVAATVIIGGSQASTPGASAAQASVAPMALQCNFNNGFYLVMVPTGGLSYRLDEYYGNCTNQTKKVFVDRTFPHLNRTLCVGKFATRFVAHQSEIKDDPNALRVVGTGC